MTRAEKDRNQERAINGALHYLLDGSEWIPGTWIQVADGSATLTIPAAIMLDLLARVTPAPFARPDPTSPQGGAS